MKEIINELQGNIVVFRALLQDCSTDLVKWKSDDSEWSILEIICHLYDEEREDFRCRLNHILSNPLDPMPPIDPNSWVTSRCYQDQDFKLKLHGFLNERNQSIQWLKSLKSPNWKSYYTHPKLGKMSAQMMLSEWLAHDFLHLRQLIKMKYKYYKTQFNSPLNYAGEW